MLPKVLITADAGIYTNPEGWRLPTFYQMEAYFSAVQAAGGLPVMAGMDITLAAEYAASCDCLLVSGGVDITPGIYGEPDRGSLGSDLRRDEFELELFRQFNSRGKRILGICRGHQLINVALGGKLVQDIKNELGVDHPRMGDHSLEISDGWLLGMFGSTAMVNSTHHQAVTPRTLAPGLIATATAEQGRLIEGCEFGENILAVQFHPERYIEQDARMLKIFRWLTQSALISD